MLKAAIAAAFLLLLATPPALADELLTGAVRDRSGAPIAGSHITGFDEAQHAIGSDIAAADGTFALTTPVAPVTIMVTCDFCQAVRRAVTPGEPVVVVVERFNAVTANGPSLGDLQALPYRRASDIASLVPFSVVSGDRITDRGLDYSGALEIDGLPFYDPYDGATADSLVPAHAVAGFAATGALAAPIYGGYATGGTFDLHLLDADVAASRLDAGDGADAVLRARGPAAGILAAVSSDDGDDRRALAADAGMPFAGGRLTVNALDVAASQVHAAGAGIAYATGGVRTSTTGSVSVTQTGASSLVTLRTQVGWTGPLQLTLGARAAHATSGADGIAGVQDDAALYAAAAHPSGIGTLGATFALDTGSDAGVAGGLHATLLTGSLSDDFAVGPHWLAHAGAAANGRLPTFEEMLAVTSLGATADRSQLGEASLTYTDLRRLRVRATAFGQRTAGPAAATVHGAGIDAAWQVAPRFSMRAWILALDGPTANPAAGAPDATPAHRLAWLTYENGVRFDALVRSGALEGDVRIPLNALDALAIGTSSTAGRRQTTLGVTLR